MELIYDWRSFQSFFYSKKRLTQTEEHFPIFLVTDGNVVISAFSEGQDFSDWVGATFDEIDAEFAHRELVLFDRKHVDQWITQSTEKTHFYDQIQFLRSKAQPHLVLRSRYKASDTSQKHFLLRVIQSWWTKLFPSTYGIYINLDRNPASSLLMIISRGRVTSFHVPDISSMIPDRRRISIDVVKYISEHHLIPVQGLFLTSQEWAEWSESENPWMRIAATTRSDRSKIVPFSWGLTLLIQIRAYFGF